MSSRKYPRIDAIDESGTLLVAELEDTRTLTFRNGLAKAGTKSTIGRKA